MNPFVHGPAKGGVKIGPGDLQVVFGHCQRLVGVGQFHLDLEQIVKGGHPHLIVVLSHRFLGADLCDRLPCHIQQFLCLEQGEVILLDPEDHILPDPFDLGFCEIQSQFGQRILVFQCKTGEKRLGNRRRHRLLPVCRSEEGRNTLSLIVVFKLVRCIEGRIKLGFPGVFDGRRSPHPLF